MGVSREVHLTQPEGYTGLKEDGNLANLSSYHFCVRLSTCATQRTMERKGLGRIIKLQGPGTSQSLVQRLVKTARFLIRRVIGNYEHISRVSQG